MRYGEARALAQRSSHSSDIDRSDPRWQGSRRNQGRPHVQRLQLRGVKTALGKMRLSYVIIFRDLVTQKKHTFKPSNLLQTSGCFSPSTVIGKV